MKIARVKTNQLFHFQKATLSTLSNSVLSIPRKIQEVFKFKLEKPFDKKDIVFRVRGKNDKELSFVYLMFIYQYAAKSSSEKETAAAFDF